MENGKSKIETVFDTLKSYVSTRINLIILKSTDKGAGVVSNVVLSILLFLLAFFFLFFLSFAAGVGLGRLFENNFLGFASVAGIYLLLIILLYIMREKWIKEPITNGMIKSMFGNKSGNEQDN